MQASYNKPKVRLTNLEVHNHLQVELMLSYLPLFTRNLSILKPPATAIIQKNFANLHST